MSYFWVVLIVIVTAILVVLGINGRIKFKFGKGTLDAYNRKQTVVRRVKAGRNVNIDSGSSSTLMEDVDAGDTISVRSNDSGKALKE